MIVFGNPVWVSKEMRLIESLRDDNSEIVGFAEIFLKRMMKNTYLPKGSISFQFGDEKLVLSVMLR